MDFGSYVSGLVTGLREGVEAALIVSIILAYLVGRATAANPARSGSAPSVAVASAILGIAIFFTVGELPEPYEQIFEAMTILVAAAVVTWMLFWMRRQAAAVKGELHAGGPGAHRGRGVGSRRSSRSPRSFARASKRPCSSSDRSPRPASRRVLGAARRPRRAAIASAIGYGFYRGTRRMNLAVFFRWTGIALIFVAAGLSERRPRVRRDRRARRVPDADGVRHQQHPAPRERARIVPRGALRLHLQAGVADR